MGGAATPAVARRLALGGLVVLTGVLFAPTLAWIVRSWQADAYYSHGPLMPLVAVWLAWPARRGARRAGGDDAGLAVVALGVVVHLVALRWALYPLSALGLLAALAGLALLAGGRALLRALALALVVLALAVPLPWVERIAPPLAAGAAHAAAAAAASVGVAVERTGAQLAVGDGAFVVGAPCSGLRSLVGLGTLAVVLAGVSGLSPLRRSLLVASAFVLAVVANWARLTTLICAADAFGTARSLGVFHALSAPAAFAAALAGVLAVGRGLGWRGDGLARGRYRDG